MIDFFIAVAAVVTVVYAIIHRFKDNKKKHPTTCNGACSGCTNKCYW